MRLSPSLLASFAVASLALSGIHCAYADAPAPHAACETDIGTVEPTVEPAPVAAGPHIELVDAGEQTLPTYVQNGRRFVLGQMGQRYQVHIVNPTGARVEAVVSVDGLDAIDGKPANVSKRGYLVPAYGDVTIDGFRTSLDTVAAFRFSSVRDSYAARTRHARNVGVVGVAFFAKRPQTVAVAPAPPPMREAPAPAANADGEASRGGGAEAPAKSESRASGAPAPAARPGLGTQFGEQRESHVVETAFHRASSSPMLVAELRYDDREGLVSRGIQLPQPWRDPRAAENDLRDTAQPFPESRFAQPPPAR